MKAMGKPFDPYGECPFGFPLLKQPQGDSPKTHAFELFGQRPFCQGRFFLGFSSSKRLDLPLWSRHKGGWNGQSNYETAHVATAPAVHHRGRRRRLFRILTTQVSFAQMVCISDLLACIYKEWCDLCAAEQWEMRAVVALPGTCGFRGERNDCRLRWMEQLHMAVVIFLKIVHTLNNLLDRLRPGPEVFSGKSPLALSCGLGSFSRQSDVVLRDALLSVARPVWKAPNLRASRKNLPMRLMRCHEFLASTWARHI